MLKGLNNRSVLTMTRPDTITEKMITDTPTFEDYTGNFEIYTLGTKRIFSDSKYHNNSREVFITSEDPGTIHVNGPGITWGYFFSTLPMKLDKSCLTTGTKQIFCTGGGKTLKFFINEIEDPNALDKEINPNDKLKVIFN